MNFERSKIEVPRDVRDSILQKQYHYASEIFGFHLYIGKM